IAKEIAGVYDGFTKARARVIARTEVGMASEAASDAAARATGLELTKEWMTAMDGRERPSHAEIDGAVVPMHDDFTLATGVRLKHPSDQSGPADEVINCRCTVRYARAS